MTWKSAVISVNVGITLFVCVTRVRIIDGLNSELWKWLDVTRFKLEVQQKELNTKFNRIGTTKPGTRVYEYSDSRTSQKKDVDPLILLCQKIKATLVKPQMLPG